MNRSAFVVTIILAAGILGTTTGCVHRGNQLALGQEVAVPAGLDTAQRRAWIEQQEGRCPDGSFGSSMAQSSPSCAGILRSRAVRLTNAEADKGFIEL